MQNSDTFVIIAQRGYYIYPLHLSSDTKDMQS